jgi:hypothetical protein
LTSKLIFEFVYQELVKNSPFASCTGPLKSIGYVAVAGLVGAVNFAIQPGGGKQVGEGKEFVAWKHQQAPFRARIWAPLTKCARSTMAGWT